MPEHSSRMEVVAARQNTWTGSMAMAGDRQTDGQEVWPWQGMDRLTDRHTKDPARLFPSAAGNKQGLYQEGLQGTALTNRLTSGMAQNLPMASA